MSTRPDAGGNEPAYLAVDGGGTKTHAVIVDHAGRPVGYGVAGGCNQHAVGLDRALAELRAAVDAASQQADYRAPFAAAWLGLAGIDRPGDVETFQTRLSALAALVRVTNDAELVLAGLEHRPGVALIAGTGSIALGIDSAGRVVRVGGWGHLIGDEGSGYDIGRRALRLALRMADGRAERGALLEQALAHFAVAREDDLIDRVYAQSSKSAIAALAPTVLRTARAGDRDARAIVRAATGELAYAVVTAARRLPTLDGPLALALSGSLLVSDAWYRRVVVRRVRSQIDVGAVSVVADPALVAAHVLARDYSPYHGWPAPASAATVPHPEQVGDGRSMEEEDVV